MRKAKTRNGARTTGSVIRGGHYRPFDNRVDPLLHRNHPPVLSNKWAQNGIFCLGSQGTPPTGGVENRK
jgi:hypothetical protein